MDTSSRPTAINTITSHLPPPPPPQNPVQNAIGDQRNHQQQQAMMNEGEEDAVNEFDEEEGEDYDHSGGEEEEEERPQLAEGFYEIEAVRKKRIRKPDLFVDFVAFEFVFCDWPPGGGGLLGGKQGKPQYLIKWRGWPESTNTWEPVENLLSCPDVIEAFEERFSFYHSLFFFGINLRSKKQRSNRKGKRKQSVGPTPTPQSKKKQKQQSEEGSPAPSFDIPGPTPTPPQSKKKQKQQSGEGSPPPSYDIPTVKLTIIEEPEPEPSSVPSVPDANFSNGTENNLGDTGNNGTTNPSTEPRVASSSNQDSLSEFAIHIQEDRPTEGVVSPAEVSPADGNGTEPVRVGPIVGSRRRKSCAVKRFKKEPNLALRNDARGNTTSDVGGGGVVAQDGIKNTNGLESDNIIDAPTSVAAVTKIIKPVEYSTSIDNDTEEVSVSFLVRRSDGEEVVVDNKYLKENNPILLINFYEHHLQNARFFE
ncbi:hypothetical protein OSB04_012891 [Centaurea solstitialis]|uniref:Chromo domain-containing protein n=1 Tax=Centaurea solstitialis TaxID=347529 RepID=A0AA38WEF2_9ASTR|nr:hypothetical protein OSB04_012891 [Centaurea solstitialis]